MLDTLPAASTRNQNRTGETIDGKYHLDKPLGAGGMGIVYRATYVPDGTQVAVKLMPAEIVSDSVAIARFQREARIIERLKHPNILQLHGYGTYKDQPYLAMQFIPGGDMNDLLRQEHLELDEISRLLEQMATALDYAHQQQVIHRDVKPANVLLDDSRNAILADFGLARSVEREMTLTQSGMLIGTPVYMAPELAGDGQLTPSVDLYALGCILYQMLTNELPFHSDTTMGYIMQQLTAERPDVRTLRPDLPPGLTTVIRRALARNVAERYPTGAALVRAFRDVLQRKDGEVGEELLDDEGTQTVMMSASLVSPFKGLEAFQEADARFFFGREPVVQQLVDSMRKPGARFLAVMGASGSGKSSVVRAGLIPRLRKGDLPGSAVWPILIFTPGVDPLNGLANQLRIFTGVNDLESQIRQDPTKLDFYIRGIVSRQAQSSSRRLVLVIDQFEEVFTRATEATRKAFLDAIVHSATVEDGPTFIVLTMRADFYHRITNYPDPRLVILFQQQQVIARPMTEAELRHAIEAPAQVAGVLYASGLVEMILADVGQESGSLPLLQYALQELFKARDDLRLTRQVYELNGGVKGALAKRAEEIYESFDTAQQALMRRILLRLVEVNEAGETTRRRIERDQLIFDNVPDEAVEDILQKLTTPEVRLLTANREWKTGSQWIDVSHEALIQRWDRLQLWVRENLSTLLLAGQLLKTAQDWRKSGEDSAYLLRGMRLDEAVHWLSSGEADALAIQRDLIAASVDERTHEQEIQEKQRQHELELERDRTRQAQRAQNTLRVMLVGAVIFIIIAVGLSIFAFTQAKAAQLAQTNAERKSAEVHSLALADSAQKALDDHHDDLAISLAMESNAIEQPPAGAQQTLARVADAVGTIRQMTDHTDWVAAVAYSPNGKTALSGSWDKTLILWDLATGKAIRTFTGHKDRVDAVAFAPDGNTALSGSWDKTLLLWDTNTGKPIRSFTGHTGKVTSVSYSPDGKTVLSGSWDKTLILWDVATGKAIRTFTGHTDHIISVAFAPDGKTALSGSADKTLILWDVATGSMIRNLMGHTDAVNSVAFAPDGKTALSGSSDKTLILWDVTTGKALRTFSGHTNKVYSVMFSPDGQLALSSSEDNSIRLWDTNAGKEIRQLDGHTAGVLAIAFSPDSKTVLSGSADNTVRLWDVEIHRFVGHTHSVSSIVFAPDGKTALSGSSDKTLNLWDVATGTQIRQFIGHTDVVENVSISPDGKTALSASDDHNIILWDLATGKAIRTFTGHTDWVANVVFSPDGKTAISGSGTPQSDKSLILWDVATGAIIRRFDGHTDSVPGLAFSPDGKTVLSGSWDKTLILWDVSTGAIIRRFTGHKDKIWSVAISPDGKTAISASADNTLKLWDLATGGEIRTFTGHTDAVLGVAISPDGKTALSGSQDRTLRLWDLATGQEIRRFEGHSDSVWSVAFSPDGQNALSASQDTTVRLWRLTRTTDELIQWVHDNRFLRDFTCDERQQFYIEPYCAVSTPVASLTTPIVAPTPSPATGIAHLGDNLGQIAIGGSQVWTYVGNPGDTVTIRANADKPADNASYNEVQQRGLFDTRLTVRGTDGTILAEADDIVGTNFRSSDSQIDKLQLPSDGKCQIEVRGFGNQSGGSYTLVISPYIARPATPAATDSATQAATPGG